MKALNVFILTALCALVFSEEDEIFESSANDAYKAAVEVITIILIILYLMMIIMINNKFSDKIKS